MHTDSLNLRIEKKTMKKIRCSRESIYAEERLLQSKKSF